MTVLDSFQNWLANYWPSWAAYLVTGIVGVSVVVTAFILLVMAFIYLERRGLSRFQIRVGPNRVGPFGILQPVADAVKVLLKEDIVPAKADKLVHWLAPVVAFLPPVLIFAVVPFQSNAILADLNVGILYVVAIGALGAVAVFMAGWASNNKYSLIAAMRAIAQMISYEVPAVLAIISVVLVTGSLSMTKIVEAQNVPFILMQPLAFIIYLVAVLAEINRTPFDLLEAESELTTGFNVEYSGMKFAMFYLSEYGHALAASAIITVLFLSGWRGPLLPPFIWFLLKTFAVFIFIFWIRSTIPRVRIDQAMGFAWKFLLPLALINMFITAGELLIYPEFPWLLLLLNIAIAGILIIVWSRLFKLGGARSAA